MVIGMEQNALNIPRGATARELISEFALFSHEIAEFFLTSYRPGPNLEERTLERSATTRFVTEALRHRGYPEPLFELHAQDLGAALLTSPPAGRVRALCSRVRDRAGSFKHLPLLDFRHPVSEEASDVLALAMCHLGETEGALLATGRSYHYYGLAPRDLGGWRRFMSQALLLTPLVDARFIAHSLIDDLACLRLDPSDTHPREPVVVRRLIAGGVSTLEF
jgi:hypothetical protein